MFILRPGLALYVLAWVSPCSLLVLTQDPLALVSQVLGLQVCVSTGFLCVPNLPFSSGPFLVSWTLVFRYLENDWSGSVVPFFSYRFSFWNFFSSACLHYLLPVSKAFLHASWLMRLWYSSLYLAVGSLAPKSPSLAACFMAFVVVVSFRCWWLNPVLLCMPRECSDPELDMSPALPRPSVSQCLLWWLEFLCNLHLLNNI